MNNLVGFTYWVTHHGVRLPRACLAVSEHTGIETLKGSFKNIKSQVTVNLEQQKIDIYFVYTITKK